LECLLDLNDPCRACLLSHNDITDDVTIVSQTARFHRFQRTTFASTRARYGYTTSTSMSCHSETDYEKKTQTAPNSNAMHGWPDRDTFFYRILRKDIKHGNYTLFEVCYLGMISRLSLLAFLPTFVVATTNGGAGATCAKIAASISPSSAVFYPGRSSSAVNACLSNDYYTRFANLCGG
jgi:hypothetical protein